MVNPNTKDDRAKSWVTVEYLPVSGLPWWSRMHTEALECIWPAFRWDCRWARLNKLPSELVRMDPLKGIGKICQWTHSKASICLWAGPLAYFPAWPTERWETAWELSHTPIFGHGASGRWLTLCPRSIPSFPCRYERPQVMISSMLGGHPHLANTAYRPSRLTASNAFMKSTNTAYIYKPSAWQRKEHIQVWWTGHVLRMPNTYPYGELQGKRCRGCPLLHYNKDVVKHHVAAAAIIDCEDLAQNRRIWRQTIMEGAMAAN